MTSTWQKIEDHKIQHIWITANNDSCCSKESIAVLPNCYEANGTPICSECGQDMIYSHTETYCENHIKNRIKKMITEYTVKIATCEKTLKQIKEQKINARQQGDVELMQDLRVSRKEWDAKKTAYIQAKADIDSLLDFL